MLSLFTATRINEVKEENISALTLASMEPCNAISGVVFESLNAKLNSEGAKQCIS
jgi:hypothetical protein